ncbi:class I SAM-dependent methyltransferase [Caballeronia arvi]|uniref:class I SAM-dependent methyltransferase n=1 Tax=Caballeronia arvi TaxID=1777135 RepID=UPI001F4406B3|nr:class I SAM-dependent methyltransferase [Caballeronia arvi]
MANIKHAGAMLYFRDIPRHHIDATSINGDSGHWHITAMTSISIERHFSYDMDKAEFDTFADEYQSLHAQNISVSGETPAFFAEYKLKDISDEMNRRGIAVRRLLDFGAGVGNSVPWARKYLPEANITCADVSERSLEIAAGRFPGEATFAPIRGAKLPFASASFDTAYAMCVFHHIVHEEHHQALVELHRVLEPGGTLVVFEHNPLNPLTVKAVNTCEFDANAKLITARKMKQACLDAGFEKVHVQYRIFFPHMLAVLRPLERYMTDIPLGAQYAVYATKT